MDLLHADDATLRWWLLLCSISLVNIAAWCWTARRVRARHQASARPPHAGVGAAAVLGFGPGPLPAIVKLQLLLSAGYVLGCAWRSWLPVFDVERQVMVDSVLSSALVGRSVATVAELCFVAQWASMLAHVAREAGSAAALRISRWLVPAIVVAEVCSWTAVLTLNNLGHVVEESLWGLSALAVAIGLVTLLPRVERRMRPVLAFAIVTGLAYVAYMFAVDVPMYWTRWVADRAAGQDVLGLGAGIVDAAVRRVVTHRWEDWRSEVVWMTLYFSVAVWLSIALVHLAAWRRPVPASRPPLTHG